MNRHHLGALSSWQSGLDFATPPTVAPRRRPARVIQERLRLARTARGSPPPLEDDVDFLGSLVFMVLFVLLVWL